VAFVAERDPFFTDFAAASCTVGGVAIDAIFHNRSDDALFVAGNTPWLEVKSTDVAATARGTAVVVDAVAYTVANIDHDGTGMARVTLEKT
jgi:hypothetical protein